MRDERQTLKIELLSQWKLEAEFRNNKLTSSRPKLHLGLTFSSLTRKLFLWFPWDEICSFLAPTCCRWLSRCPEKVERIERKGVAIFSFCTIQRPPVPGQCIQKNHEIEPNTFLASLVSMLNLKTQQRPHTGHPKLKELLQRSFFFFSSVTLRVPPS